MFREQQELSGVGEFIGEQPRRGGALGTGA